MPGSSSRPPRSPGEHQSLRHVTELLGVDASVGHRPQSTVRPSVLDAEIEDRHIGQLMSSATVKLLDVEAVAEHLFPGDGHEGGLARRPA